MGKNKKKSRNKLQRLNSILAVLCVCALGLLMAVVALSCLIERNNGGAKPGQTNEISNPESFTWEQYQALTPEQKQVFPGYFESMDAYNAWYERVQPMEQVSVPVVDLAGKKPEDFTWEEYEALTPEQKMIFPDYFESMDAYNAWYESVRPTEETDASTMELLGKKPEDFTWEEYEALTPEQKLVFVDYFESMDAYNAWYESVQPTEKNDVPTVELLGKKPEDFTWEEYEALTPEQKMIFPDYFESMDAYNAWYESVQPTEGTDESTLELWGKKPEDFTWEEYEALTPEQKLVFPDYFESIDAYHAWYERVKPKETEPSTPEIDMSEKKPEEYTWEDYQKLSIEEQMIFPDYFESFEAYQEWYDRVCP